MDSFREEFPILFMHTIISKKYAEYWNIVSENIKGLSQELKNLYLKMVAFDPKERPTIKQILDDDWMKEIREMNNEQLMQLENEIREEFLRREPLIEIGKNFLDFCPID